MFSLSKEGRKIRNLGKIDQVHILIGDFSVSLLAIPKLK